MKMAIKVENVDVSVVARHVHSCLSLCAFAAPWRHIYSEKCSGTEIAPKKQPSFRHRKVKRSCYFGRAQESSGSGEEAKTHHLLAPLTTEYIYQIIIKLQIAVCYTNEVKLADAWLLLPKTALSSLAQTNKGTHLIGHQAITGLSVSAKGAAADGVALAEETWIRSKCSLRERRLVESNL